METPVNGVINPRGRVNPRLKSGASLQPSDTDPLAVYFEIYSLIFGLFGHNLPSLGRTRLCASVVEAERTMKINIRNSKLKKRRVSGFRKRNSTKAGRKVLNRRRARGRTATVFG